MLLDLTPLSSGVDAAALLQQALDAGPVELPAAVLTLSRPVYLPPDAELTGAGRRSVLQTATGGHGHDALVAVPPAVRYHDPALHFAPNAVDSARYAFRTLGGAGMRFGNTIADVGWPGSDHWAAVRQFAVEFVATRHGGSGGVCGIAWGGAGQFRPAPWYVSQHPDHQTRLDFCLALADGSTIVRRFLVGAPDAVARKYRFAVDLDAGSVACEVDGVAVTDVQEIGVLSFEDGLADNPGAAMWVGGVSTHFAGDPPPELGCADVTFHTFRLWRTASPPASGYEPFGWYQGTAFVLPLATAGAPRTGDPAVAFTGEHNGFGYLVPLVDSGDLWVKSVRVSDVALRGGRYGAAVAVASALDVAVDRVHVDGFAVALQVLGGPLPSYPVRVRDLTSVRPADTAVRLQWTISRLDGVTAHYPARSVVRADNCGMTGIRDVFHAGENAGPDNTVTDVMRFDTCGVVNLDGILSNYEDGFGPRRSYVAFTGRSPEPSQPQILRITDFGRGQALRPGAKYLDMTGAGPTATDVRDSF
jgi:hypothetical protein